jgi:hypothetical protein
MSKYKKNKNSHTFVPCDETARNYNKNTSKVIQHNYLKCRQK